MKWKDIREAIVRAISTGSPDVEIYEEEVERPKFPYLFVDLVDYKKDFHSEHKEMKSIIIDIRAHMGPKARKGRGDIIEMLETVDDAFDHMGLKVLRCSDSNGSRVLTVKDADLSIVDMVGHYTFTLDLFDLYGAPYDYALMEDLYLNLENN